MSHQNANSLSAPLFSVVVPYLNAAKHFRYCLQGLTDQTFRNAEFIMVDNGSTDESPMIAAQWAAEHPGQCRRLFSETKPGPSAARNFGAGQARGQWIAFTDADCQPHPSWLSDLSSAIQALQPGVSAIAGCIRPAPTQNLIAKFLGLYTLPPVQVPGIFKEYTLTDGGFPTANLAVRREIFKELGGMDETYFPGEDHDLCRRLYARGHAIQTLTNAIVFHHHRNTLKAMLRQTHQFGFAHARLLKTHPKALFIFQAPGFTLRKHGRTRAWIDINQADKKLLALLLLSACRPLCALLIPVYFLFLMLKIHRLALARAVRLSWLETLPATILLAAKSAALTLGRIDGSARHKTLCL